MPPKKMSGTNRLNKSCAIVLQALKLIKTLSSAQEIYFWLKENHPDDAPALTTVYRAIENLLRLDLIQAVDIGAGEKLYEMVEPGMHHHHLVCMNCHDSIHLDQCFVETLAEKVAVHHGFRVRSHVLEIFGLCQKCANQ